MHPPPGLLFPLCHQWGSAGSGFGEAVEASAVAYSASAELPPPDTVVGRLKFANGKPASVSISFAASVLRFSLSVTGTKGSLEVC